MILFVCSLFAGAIGYVKRQKLAQTISMNLARPGTLLFRRLTQISARSTSVPAVTTGTNVVCRSDRVEIIFRENWTQLELNQWHTFDLIQKKLQDIADSPVYFVASMTPGVDDENKIRRAIEERCIPIAWRAEDNLDVLFGSSQNEFVDLICDWSENLILYRNFFDLTKLETVLLSVDFKKSLIFIPQTPSVVAQVNPSSPEHQSTMLKGLEKLCLKDIVNAKDLCRNIATFTTPDWTSNNTSLNSLNSTPQSPTISILVQPTSMTFHSTSTVSIPCKFSPIEEVPTSSSHQNLTLVTNGGGGEHTSSLINFDDIDDDDGYLGDRRRSPCHGFNERLVDRQFYRTNSRSSSMSSVITDEPKRRGSEKKLTKSTLNVSDRYASLSRRYSLQSSNQTRSRSASSSIKFRRLSTTTNREKPPNILIYCGSDDDANDGTFEKLRNSLRRSLNTSKYVIYRLKHCNFFKDPWGGNASCLVLADFKNLDERFWTKLFDYFRSGGKLLFLCENRLLSSLSDTNSAKKRFGLLKLAFDGHGQSSNSGSINKEVEKFLKKLSKNLNSRRVCEQCHVKDADGRYKYTLSVLREVNSPLIFYMQNSHERAGALFSDMTMDMFLNEGDGLIKQILERLGLDVEQLASKISLSCGYLLFSDENCLSLEIEKSLLGKGRFDGKLTLDFKENLMNDVKAKEDYLPVRCSVGRKNYPKDFDGETYFSNLKSVTLGKSVLYVPVATSTMIVYDSLSRALPTESSFIVIAKHQVNGQGRSGNQWLSPAGCAMFTLGYQTTMSAKIGQYAGFVQHIIALSVVDSICKLPFFQAFDLRLKWPNDIYYGRTTKLGGVLVNCLVQGDKLKLNIGCGVNVSNSAPTVCLNDVLPNEIEPFTCEQTIALVVTRFEELLETFASGGHEAIWPLYYQYWLHDHQELTVAETNERVTVRGLDKYGFLEVRSRQSGKSFSLQPDGNSLDMMHNLIRVKS